MKRSHYVTPFATAVCAACSVWQATHGSPHWLALGAFVFVLDLLIAVKGDR